MAPIPSSRKGDWRAVLTEGMATMFFLYIGTAVVTVTSSVTFDELLPPRLAVIAATQGMSYAILLYYCIASAEHTGVGFMNPVVTLCLAMTNHIHGTYNFRGGPIMRALWYILAQTVGGVLGTVLTMATIPNAIKGKSRIGAPSLGYGSTFWSATSFEALCTFALVFIIMCTFLRRRFDAEARTVSAPLAAGFALTALQLFAYPFTGAALNPIRAFAPFLCSFTFTNWPVYAAGPLVGGLFALLLFVVSFTNETRAVGFKYKHGAERQ